MQANFSCLSFTLKNQDYYSVTVYNSDPNFIYQKAYKWLVLPLKIV